MKLHCLEINETFILAEESKNITRNEWDEEFKVFFKELNKKYNKFELMNFLFVIQDEQVFINTEFNFEPEKNWDMTDSIESADYFNSELHGVENSVGRLFGNWSGNTSVNQIPEIFLHSELFNPFHDKYVVK